MLRGGLIKSFVAIIPALSCGESILSGESQRAVTRAISMYRDQSFSVASSAGPGPERIRDEASDGGKEIYLSRRARSGLPGRCTGILLVLAA